MEKKLITLKEIRTMHREGIRELYVNDKTIITPGARDFAHENEFRVIYGDNKESPLDIRERIQYLLGKDYEITDKEKLDNVVDQVLKRVIKQ